MLRQTYAKLAAGMLCLLLTACGGGGGSSVGSTLPSSVGSTSTAGGSQNIQFSITVPSTTTTSTASTATQSSASRSLQYVSSATASAQIAVTNSSGITATPTTVNCTSTCSATISAPVGTDIFTVKLYSATNATGSILSTGSASATVISGANNTVNVSFGGVVARVAITAASTTLTKGAASQLPLIVTAYDASNNIIVGAQAYSTPITLKDSDTSGATSLTNASITSPTSTTALKYTGATFTSATITASLTSGTSLSTQALALTSTTAATPAPVSTTASSTSGTTTTVTNTAVLAHIKTYAQLAGNFESSSTSSGASAAAWATIAKYVDYVETDNRAAVNAHAAGIKVGFYTDPIKAHGTAELSWPSTAYAHDCAGNLIIPNYPEAYEQFGNVAAPALATGWDAEIATHEKDQWGSYPEDFVRSDDSEIPSSHAPGYYFAAVFGGAVEPSTTPYCNYTNASFVTALRSFYAQSPLPVLFNGATDATYTQYTSGESNIMGGQCESCFGGWTGSYWQDNVNAEIAMVSSGKIFHAFSHGNSSSAQQLYAYASLLLGYDPNYTILSQDYSTPSGIGQTALALLVPMNPTSTGTSVSTYLTSQGVYVRQWGACYINKVSVGPCAVAVNSSTGSETFPTSLSNYHHTVSFSGLGIATALGDTGAVSATGSAPSSTMSSMTAQIVFQ